MLNILYSFFVLIVSAPALVYVRNSFPQPFNSEWVYNNHFELYVFTSLALLFLISLCVFGYKIAKARYHTKVDLSEITISKLPTVLPKKPGVLWNNGGSVSISGETLNRSNLNPLMGNVETGNNLITNYTPPSYSNPSN